MRNFLFVTVAAILSASIYGCSRMEGGSKERVGRLKNSVSYTVDGSSVTDFTLADGTRCVSRYQGGIDCDFKNERIEK